MAKDLELSYGTKDKETGEIVEAGQINLRVPETLDEARSMWGEEVALSKAISAVKVDAQRIARSAENADKAQEAINSWVPGVAKERESTGASLENFAKKLSKMPKEKLAELLAKAGINVG